MEPDESGQSREPQVCLRPRARTAFRRVSARTPWQLARPATPHPAPCRRTQARRQGPSQCCHTSGGRARRATGRKIGTGSGTIQQGSGTGGGRGNGSTASSSASNQDGRGKKEVGVGGRTRTTRSGWKTEIIACLSVCEVALPTLNPKPETRVVVRA